ncbi:MAG: hypothetical protein NVSMB24_00750 [Mucilaginibacter sp.]
MLESVNTPGFCMYADIGVVEDSVDVISDFGFSISDFYNFYNQRNPLITEINGSDK